MKQNEKNQVRESAMNNLTDLEFEGFSFYGRVQEGVAFEKDGNFVVVKAVFKKEDFADEVDELIEEFARKQAKKENKGKEKESADSVVEKFTE